MSQSQEVFRPV